jgi:hypothetical protein
LAVITATTFDPLKRYVRVRLAQGVPIVDADWNEADDVRQFELRAFLKWGVGDGVLEGPDAFRIVGSGLADDFTISAGLVGTDPAGITDFDKALYRVGRCLVNGLDVMIGADVRFTAQPAHTAPDDAALVAHLAGTVLVYLDVWEHLVTPTDDPNLILPGLGTESCSRMKREWMVRVRAGTVVPQPGDADYAAGNSYYALAAITRRAGDPLIQPGDVTDLRDRHLQVMPNTLITDTLGVGVNDYRHGLQRPAVNLREAINDLIRGEAPASPAGLVSAPGWASIAAYTPGIVLDQSNGITVVFDSTNNNGASWNVFASRLDLGNPGAGFGPFFQVTTAAVGKNYFQSQGVQLPNGDYLVVWTDWQVPSAVRFKRGTLAGLAAAPEQTVGAAAQTSLHNPTVVLTGSVVTFFFAAYETANPTVEHLYYRRFHHADNTWVDASPQILPPMPGGPFGDLFSVSPDTAGNIWIAVQASTQSISACRFMPPTATIDHVFTLSSVSVPNILATSTGNVWVLGQQVQPGGTPGIRYAVFDGQFWYANAYPLIHTGAASDTPRAVEMADGAIWFFWAESFFAIQYMRGWGVPRQLNLRPGISRAYPVSIGNSIYVFWGQQPPAIYFRRLLTQI